MITRVEYFFDTDPGFGNAIGIPVNADTAINTFAFNADISGLGAGLHCMFIRSKDSNGKWSITRNQYLYKFPPTVNSGALPAITQFEYFIDTDPGLGNAINIPVTADSVINAFAFNADISNLSAGLHSLFIRSKDAAGQWSITRNQYLYKFPPTVNSGALPNIVKLEYFIDTDPGLGNAINIPVTSDSVINAFAFNADISNLSAGLHSLFIRSKDAAGQWSITRNQYLYKFPPTVNSGALPNIVKLEYFIDTDPGFGNAINIPITADSVINTFAFNANISNLSAGLHSLFIRSKDAAGQWSITRNQYLYKFPPTLNSGALPNIVKLEYFIDTDPGLGNAINIPITADSVINAFAFNADISNLSAGLHSLFIRSKDSAGQWSITRNQYLYKFPPTVNSGALPAIVKLEYFIDTDPGFDNAINIPITLDSVINAFAFNADISNLSAGLHSLFIRSKDAAGQWSITRNQYLYKFPPTVNSGALPNIVKLEYFIDTDPGFGNAINIPVTADSVINAFAFNADISNLSAGLHSLFIRSKDAGGQWSITRNQYLYKFPPTVNSGALPAIVKLEYFIDTDPGFGNAINIPVTADSVINAFAFNADISNLSAGLHSLFIRSKDAGGQWSITRNQYLYKFPPVVNNGILPVIVKLEYFIDTDPGFGHAINIPITSDSVINNLMFPIDTTGLGYGTHVVSVRSLDANGKWSLTRNSKFTRDNLRLFIQGYYAGGGTMVPVLFNEGISSNTSLTDTITVELHNPTYPYALKETVRAMLNTDGSVHCSFTNSIGSYYIVIKHRNTIETWSASPVVLGSGLITYDFSTAANKAYGSKQKQMETGVWSFYSADINQDDNVDLLDMPVMEIDINNFGYGYKKTDINGDGNIDLLDLPIIESNITNFIFSSHP